MTAASESQGDALSSQSTLARSDLSRFLPQLCAWLRLRAPDVASAALRQVGAAALTALDLPRARGLGALWSLARARAWKELAKLAERAERSSRSTSAVVTAADAESRRVAVAFDRAAEQIEPALREAVLLRLELGLDYAAIAAECRLADAPAARAVVARAIVLLARRMRNDADA